jgi:hypothetical protein
VNVLDSGSAAGSLLGAYQYNGQNRFSIDKSGNAVFSTSVSASALSGSGANVTGVVSSSYATNASAATSITFVPASASYAGTASAAAPNFVIGPDTRTTDKLRVSGSANFAGPVTSSAGLMASGSIVSGSIPVLSGQQVWGSSSTVFTASLVNVLDSGSAAGSQLLALQVNGQIQFYVDKTGFVQSQGNIQSLGSLNASTMNPYFINIGNINSSTTFQSGVLPAGNAITLTAQNFAGRALVVNQTANQESYFLQPAIFKSQIFEMNAGAGASLTSQGTQASTSGTITHVAWSDSCSYMAVVSTSNAVSASAIVQTFMPQVGIGTIMGGAGGFFYSARIQAIGGSASYAGNAAGTTGSRMFIGLNAISSASRFLADQTSLTASCIGFLKGFGTSDPTAPNAGTNWQFVVGNSITGSYINTAMPFNTASVYDFTIFVPPNKAGSPSQSVQWRIDNRNFEGGNTSSFNQGGMYMPMGLPSPSQSLYSGIWLLTYSANTVPFAFQNIYVETVR